MRSAYRILAILIALGVVVQAAVIAGAWFLVLNDLDSGTVLDKNSEGNWAHVVHGQIGVMVMPLLALLLLIVSFFARIPGGVKWAAITLGVTILQVVLAFAGFAAPVLGLLHGVNAFAIAGVAGVAARKAREATSAVPASPAAVS
ncbi:hypothetical protein [Actinoplanes aureus]|uniref:Uncharacterized protein n=1 Tax=Actinoplanes aureus TaxID=2792083 RepID=A0A931FUF8_9ACTN|nr:hypothetical protein [Actinoplanes aureus]MBG0560173.1 hypothetical protein [Actinoplanes aureus]